MKNNFRKLLTFLELDNEAETIEGKLIELLVDERSQEWFFNIELNKPLEIEVFKRFEERLLAIPSRVTACASVKYQVEYETVDYQTIEAYYNHVIDRLVKAHPRFNSVKDFAVDIQNDVLNIVCPKDALFVESMLYDIKKHLHLIGFEITPKVRFCNETPSITERIEQLDEEEMLVAEREHQPKVDRKRFVSYKERKVKKISHKIEDIPVTEDALTEYKSMHHKADFTVEGIVINSEERKLNQRTTLFTFVLSNQEDSIYVKKFVKDNEEALFLRQTTPSMLMKVQGTAQYDQFVDEVVLTALIIERTDAVIDQEYRNDEAKERRVELHLHSKMSTLDGIDSISDSVNTALRFKHEAIALTDHNTVQAFPDFYKATKNKPIKPIYGVELNFVDEDDVRLAWNSYEGSLKDAVYTVFDIETTSLSVHTGKIIEISAVKIKDHQITESFNAFVNPQENLSDFTKRLTGIKQSDVSSADTIDRVLPKFKAFFEGTIMVAHNARFDMGHIYENLRNLGLYDRLYPTIDTLQIARQLYPELKRFNLKAVAKHFKVELQRHHRAEYDTRATADIFMHMLTDLSRLGLKSYQDLLNISELRQDLNPYANTITSEITVLVKNEVGLKNLYKLVSLANTEYYFKEPVIPKKVLDKYREGLLLGSGCMHTLFFETALNGSLDNLRKKAQYYDYIEIQPVDDYLHLVEKEARGKENIIAAIERIVAVAKEFSLPVVATGDVHHIEEHAYKYRDIYIQTPVVGGGLHALSHVEKIPKQYFRTTEEMKEAFRKHGLFDEATLDTIVVENPLKIARSIEVVQPFKPELYAPTDDFLARQGIPSVERKMIKMVYDEAHRIYGNPLPELVEDRLKKELKSITENKFSTVYYISHLLVKKSLDEGYLVGSRGSVGSSLVATLMAITEVNPLPPHYVCKKCHFTSFKMSPIEKEKYGIHEHEKLLQEDLERVSSGFDLPQRSCPSCHYPLKKEGHDIPFETFLGFKGDKVPDIDLNFSGDYQPIVHEYIRDLFGQERTFRAGTISTVADKTAFGYVKGYIEKKNLTLRKAEIERRAKVIAGVKRSTGQHPGGIVVVPDYKEIYDVTPVQYPADAVDSLWRTTHFDYHAFEDNLFKLDVLGHDDPTMIRYLMDFVKADPINFPFKDAVDIPLDDPKVYKLLSGTEIIGLKPNDIRSEVASYGIPEMGTSFVRGMLKDSRPKSFADIVKISGLSHGTDVWLNNAETLVTGKNAKYGKIPFKDVIGCRDDIMVYLISNGLKSEIAFEISEFIRRGKAEKNPDQWEGYKMIMREHAIPEWYIWSAGQIKYMFPKAHATAYVMMALRIAWFKLYRPIYFYSAYFSKRATHFDLIAMQGGEYTIENRLREIDELGNKASDVDRRLYTVLEVALEMIKRGYQFEPIDIVQSEATDFVVCKNNQSLRLPFVALDGLGGKVAKTIVDARNEKAFSSREDIKARTSLSTTLFNRLEALGAFGELPETGQINLFDF